MWVKVPSAGRIKGAPFTNSWKTIQSCYAWAIRLAAKDFPKVTVQQAIIRVVHAPDILHYIQSVAKSPARHRPREPRRLIEERASSPFAAEPVVGIEKLVPTRIRRRNRIKSNDWSIVR